MIIQGPPEGALHWLYTNAPAAWLSALVAIVTCVYLLRSRKKPKRLVIRESRNTSVVTIRPSVRDKIKMTFDDKPIKTLGQIDGDIFNEGSDVIQRPTFSLTLSEKSVVLDVSVTPQESEIETKIDRNTLSITLPYLNPIREHGQILKLSLLVDGDTQNMRAVGGGEGWSVRHLRLPGLRHDIYFYSGLLTFNALFLVYSYWHGRYLERNYGIPANEWSWRAFNANLPSLVFLLAILVLFVTFSSRFLRRIKERLHIAP
jgi:hypothetical protein